MLAQIYGTYLSLHLEWGKCPFLLLLKKVHFCRLSFVQDEAECKAQDQADESSYEKGGTRVG